MMKKEIWKGVPGYEGLYEASNLGRVKTLQRKNSIGYLRAERIMSPGSNMKGYGIVLLWKEGRRKGFGVQVIVAMAFFGHKPNGHKIVVDHINNDISDNRAENLQLITHRENVVRGKTCRGGTSQYVGVVFHKATNKWMGQICINDGKRKNLGLFDSEIAASNAYQAELIRISI